MLRFKQYLLEYLTPDQHAAYSKFEMMPKARKDTDHFFGEGNDRVVEDVKNYQHDKSEPHKKVEQHLGQTISHDDYRAGQIQDPKYPTRKVKIGKLIKDDKLRDEFNADNTRAGKSLSKPRMSIVRGVHVAGQTNPEPDALHPTGHSWAQQSCKNIKNGSRNDGLNAEIGHGTVVVFGHDHDGKEIYRATLQPHHTADDKHTVYGLDSEYGIKHPSFTAHAHDVAKRLSVNAPKHLTYIKNDNVYNDNGVQHILHPSIEVPDLLKIMKTGDTTSKIMALHHPNANHEVFSHGIKDENASVRYKAASHPNANHEILSQAIKDEDSTVRYRAAMHPNANHEILSQGMKDEDSGVRWAAAMHPNANHEILSHAIKDEDRVVRTVAASHPNANHEILSQAIKDEHAAVRYKAVMHPNANHEILSQGIKDQDPLVRHRAAMHPNANHEILSQAIKDKSVDVRKAAASHPNANHEILSQAIKDENRDARYRAAMHPNANPEILSQGMKDEWDHVRSSIASLPNANHEILSQAIKDPSKNIRYIAAMHPNANHEILSQAIKDPELIVRRAAETRMKELKAKEGQ